MRIILFTLILAATVPACSRSKETAEENSTIRNGDAIVEYESIQGEGGGN